MDWELAQIVLPLILPKNLPDFSSLEKISNYFVETVSRVFKFVLDVDIKNFNNFDNFLKNPPTMELQEVFDVDGIVSHCSEEYKIQGGQDPRTFLYSKNESTELNFLEYEKFVLIFCI